MRLATSRRVSGASFFRSPSGVLATLTNVRRLSAGFPQRHPEGASCQTHKEDTKGVGHVTTRRLAALAPPPSCLFPDFSTLRPSKPFAGLTQWITSSNTRRAFGVRDSRCLRASLRGLAALRASSPCLFPDFSRARRLA